MPDFPYERLTTRIHIPEGGVREFEIEGHVYFARGDAFHWDDGKTYSVERTIFVMQKHSSIGREGLHVYLGESVT